MLTQSLAPLLEPAVFLLVLGALGAGSRRSRQPPAAAPPRQLSFAKRALTCLALFVAIRLLLR